MNVCHITQYCHPVTRGGTERYIADLISGLSRHGVTSCIGWLDNAGRTEHFETDGTPVIPLPAPVTRFDPPPADCVRAAAELLARHRPDLLHFHTFGRTEALLARLALTRDIPYTFTYHSPAWSCRQGSLLRWGHIRCDGEVRTWRCSACKLQQRLRCPRWIAWLGAAASVPFGALFLGTRGNAWRRRTAFVYESSLIRKAFREFLANISLTVSCCEWSTPLLKLNGARADRLVTCPQGVPLDIAALEPAPRHPRRDTFTVGFVGRLTPVKGAHVLVDAFRRTRYPAARLKLYGWSSGRYVSAYAQRVERMAQGDTRIVFSPSIPFEELLHEYRKLDLLAIPSDWPETGPLVMLEAFGVGVPAWGSNGIGQLEMLRQHGRMISPNTPEEWREALEGAFRMHQRHEWHTWANARATGPLRNMQDVADEMLAHYRNMRRRDGKTLAACEERD